MGQNTKTLDVREGPSRLRMLKLLKDHGRASFESQLVMMGMLLGQREMGTQAKSLLELGYSEGTPKTKR